MLGKMLGEKKREKKKKILLLKITLPYAKAYSMSTTKNSEAGLILVQLKTEILQNFWH